MKKKICSYKVRKYKHQRVIILDCKNCKSGSSSITDPTCREYIFRILNCEPAANRLVLSHLFDRDYEMENLDFLYLLARFINNIHEYKNSEFGTEGEQYTTQKEWLLSIINASTSDPVKAYSEIREKIKTLQKSNAKASIESNFISLLEKMISNCTNACRPDKR